MKIFTFEKSFQQRIDGIKLVLDEGDGVSIREQWKEFLETFCEIAGYKAVWKISKGMCEMLNITFPVEVYGEVKNTDFEELTIDFMIEKVQDESIQLPEVCQVPIEDIYPTICQKNKCLNVEVTANYLDNYRFFYKYIFLPFDADDEKGWAAKNLELRVKLFYDLKNKKLSKGISSYIRQIIAEVKYLQFKRDILTNSFDDNSVESMFDDTKAMTKETIAKLLEYHLKINKIKQEIEILVNPEMRDAYETFKFGRKLESGKQIFVISKTGTVNEQINLLEQLKKNVSTDTNITWMKDLCEAMSCSTNDTEIYIPKGHYSFSFMDYLNNNLLFHGLGKACMDSDDESEHSTLFSTDKASMLFVINGDIKFESLIIDCKNVKTGFLIKSGYTIIKNSLIYGLNTTDSSVSEAFNVIGDSHLVLENCVIKNFATAFNVNDFAKIVLRNCKIENCFLGININGDDAKVSLMDSIMSGFDSYGIVKYTDELDAQRFVSVENSDALNKLNINLSGSNKFDSESNEIIKVVSNMVEDESIEVNDDDTTMET